MKKEYIKPELITEDFSMQIFLQNCYLANYRVGTADRKCFYYTGACRPCTYPTQKNLSNMKPHP
jgi:hypothetical protein